MRKFLLMLGLRAAFKPFELVLRGGPVLTYYTADLEVGSPPQRLRFLVDTGSYALVVFAPKSAPGRPIAPRFASTQSSSFAAVACGESLLDRPCRNDEISSNDSRCTFLLRYSDRATYKGFFARERFSSAGAQVLAFVTSQRGPPLVLALDLNISGVLGLLPRQRGEDATPGFLAGIFGRNRGTFGLCLAASGGRLRFGGPNVALHLPGAKALRLRSHSDAPEGFFSVAVAGVELEGHALGGAGINAMFDSGSMGIYLPQAVYNKLRLAFASFCVGDQKRCAGARELAQMFIVPKDISARQAMSTFPRLVFRFKGGGLFELRPETYLTTWGAGSLMAAFEPGEEFLLGSAFMRDHDFTFDVARREISIVRSNCGAASKGRTKKNVRRNREKYAVHQKQNRPKTVRRPRN